ncbi:MAG: acylneuraminate cytidylyltransferase [Synergistaceae bacterium]|jgi:N-acylneuraminate cytidylyltransferase|nr:acylneuraminate cytidylyltransferase [Synergistaceae bacterium]
MKEIVSCLIPLRGGSKSILLKNIKLIAGKPLCFWVIDAATRSCLFDKIYVSTDSLHIEDVVQSLNIPGVEIVKRPDIYASDTSSTEEVILHLTRLKNFDTLFTIQATSPLTGPEDLRGAYKVFKEGRFDSLLTGVSSKRFFWSHDGIPLNYDYKERPLRQDFHGCVMENGAFYITKKEILLTHRNRLGGKIAVYSMPKDTAVEIDEPEDWAIVEQLLKKRSSQNLGHIKMLITDVDGVLTDSGMYYSSNGDEFKKFNTRDGKAMELLKNAGIEIAVVTSEDTQIVSNRAKKLRVEYLFQNVQDKYDILQRVESLSGISRTEMAYIGDDLNDEKIIDAVGYSYAPADAVHIIKIKVSHVLNSKGGAGAFREAAEHILENRKV